jgi:protein TonB
MFEDSLVVSQVHSTSTTKRWTTVASIGLQFAAAAFVIALPLVHPEKLALQMNAPSILMPLPEKPPVPVTHTASAAASSEAAAPTVALRPPIPIPVVLHPLPQSYDVPPTIAAVPSGMGRADGVITALGAASVVHGPVVRVAPAKGLVRVSSGVSAGMLISPIRPAYPAIARVAHVEGTVVVEATISSTGSIEDLRVISGPAMLRPAALEAIRAARYRPYRLNGVPTAVETTICINFRLGS